MHDHLLGCGFLEASNDSSLSVSQLMFCSQNGPLGSTPEVKMDLWGQPQKSKWTSGVNPRSQNEALGSTPDLQNLNVGLSKTLEKLWGRPQTE